MNATVKSSEMKIEAAKLLQTTVDKLSLRLVGTGFFQYCSRCGGSGNYSFNLMYGTVCFKCHGSGKAPVNLSEKVLDEIKAYVEAGKLASYLEEVRANTLRKNLAKKFNDTFFHIWHNLPECKKEETLHFMKLSELHYAINTYCSKLFDSVKSLAFDLSTGSRWITVKEERKGGHYQKLTVEEQTEYATKLNEAIELCRNAQKTLTFG